ncbi:MAG TPA: alpha/beta hydrolase-fold protein [Marmoricola sp.]|nr:alpha/beta hydrolase-fold protein [Marmoricola sp.]
MSLSRRTLLAGAAGGVVALGTGGVLVNKGVLPGRVPAYRLLGLDGEDAPIPHVTPGARHDGAFASQARGGTTTGWSLSVPPSHEPAGLPLVVCLHGAGADHTTAFDTMGVDRFLAQAVAAGVPPFVIASVDGGPASYWHPRTDGTDASAMVMDELVPMLRERFALRSGLGLYGWSMGGYGALRLAVRRPGIAAVAACSPALFASYGDTSPGSFDDRRQFDEEDLVRLAPRFGGVPLRIDCGKGDPFYFRVREFVDRLTPRPSGGFEAGGHTYGYMRRMLPAQLAFLGRQLAG